MSHTTPYSFRFGHLVDLILCPPSLDSSRLVLPSSPNTSSVVTDEEVTTWPVVIR